MSFDPVLEFENIYNVDPDQQKLQMQRILDLAFKRVAKHKEDGTEAQWWEKPKIEFDILRPTDEDHDPRLITVTLKYYDFELIDAQ